MSLDEAVELGCANSEDLQTQEIRVKAAERKSGNSWNAIIPSLNLSAADTVNFPSKNLSSDESVNSFSLEGSASVSIKSDLLNMVSKSKTDFEIERMQYLLAFYGVRKTLSDSYFDLAELKREIEIKTEAAKNLEDIHAESKAKYQRGFLSETDYLASKILSEKSKAELSVLKLNFNQQLQSFKQVIGLDPETEITMQSDLAEIQNAFATSYKKSKAEIESAMQTQNFPEVRLLEYQKRSAEQNLKAKKTEIFGPEFNLSYNGGPVFSYPKTEDTGRFKNSVTARVSIPLDSLFSTSKSREELRDCKDEIAMVSIQLENKKKSLTLELKNLMQQLDEQSAALRTYSQLLEITERNVTLCQNNYAKGLLDFQSLKNASSEYLDAQVEYSSKITEILKIYSAIEHITAKRIR
ncbi:MAG: TolC family protein [Treponemataceae bacterium]|nr:TolC family protein [Treponemataceae bacterium]